MHPGCCCVVAAARSRSVEDQEVEMCGARILSQDEIDDLVGDTQSLFCYLKQPLDTRNTCALVISSLNQANVMLRAMDALYLLGEYDSRKDVEYLVDREFGGLLPQPSAADLSRPGGHQEAIATLRAGLRADLELLEFRRSDTDSLAEEKYAYKIIRSLEAEISRIQANQEGEYIGYRLHQRPSTVPDLPFTTQCGYTAAVAARHIVDAALDLLLDSLAPAICTAV
jgi:hypothetical protein